MSRASCGGGSCAGNKGRVLKKVGRKKGEEIKSHSSRWKETSGHAFKLKAASKTE